MGRRFSQVFIGGLLKAPKIPSLTQAISDHWNKRLLSLNFSYWILLVGGFKPFEKYYSNWESSPNRGEHKKYLKPPPRLVTPRKLKSFKPTWLRFGVLQPCFLVCGWTTYLKTFFVKLDNFPPKYIGMKHFPKKYLNPSPWNELS